MAHLNLSALHTIRKLRQTDTLRKTQRVSGLRISTISTLKTNKQSYWPWETSRESPIILYVYTKIRNLEKNLQQISLLQSKEHWPTT